MTIVRWEPFNNLSRLQDHINRMFEEAFSGASRLDEDLAACAWKPDVDIYENDEGTVIVADLPGVPRDHIALEIKDDVLTLSGERADVDAMPPERFVRKERGCGTFRRTFRMPMALDPASISARFKDGVLEIRIPKPEAEKVRKVPITID